MKDSTLMRIKDVDAKAIFICALITLFVSTMNVWADLSRLPKVDESFINVVTMPITIMVAIAIVTQVIAIVIKAEFYIQSHIIGAILLIICGVSAMVSIEHIHNVNTSNTAIYILIAHHIIMVCISIASLLMGSKAAK